MPKPPKLSNYFKFSISAMALIIASCTTVKAMDNDQNQEETRGRFSFQNISACIQHATLNVGNWTPLSFQQINTSVQGVIMRLGEGRSLPSGELFTHARSTALNPAVLFPLQNINNYNGLLDNHRQYRLPCINGYRGVTGILSLYDSNTQAGTTSMARGIGPSQLGGQVTSILIPGGPVAISNREEEEILCFAPSLITQSMNPYIRGKIIQTLRTIPPHDRRNVLTHVNSLITESMSIYCRDSLILVVSQIPASERDDILTHAHYLINQARKGYDCMIIIEAIREIPANDRESVLVSARSLITPAMDEFVRRDLLKAIRKIPVDDRGDILSHTQALLKQHGQHINIYTPIKIIKFFRKIPSSNLKDILVHAQFLITPAITLDAHLKIIEEIGKIPDSERVDILTHAQYLITPAITLDAHLKIIEEIGKTPASDRKNVLMHAEALITEEMVGESRKHIIEAIRNIPASERVDILTHAQSLMAPQYRSGYYYKIIIEEIGKIPANYRKQIVDCARSLITAAMDGLTRINLIRAIREISVNDRADVLSHTQALFFQHGQDINRDTPLRIIKFFRKIPSSNLKDIMAHAQYLIPRAITLDAHLEIIEEIGKIPASDRKNILMHAKNLIAENMDGESCTRLIEAIRNIPANERVDILTHVQSLMAPQYRSGYYYKIIIEEIGKISANDREEILDYVRSLITPVMGASERINIIRAITTLPSGERKNIMENFHKIVRSNQGTEFYQNILTTLANMDRQERNSLCNYIHRYYGKISSPRDLWASQIIPLETIETFAKSFKSQGNSNLLAYFFICMDKDASFKELVFNYWHHLFLQPNENRSRELADFILNSVEGLGIYEAHPLAQEAIQVSILLNNPQESSNPYNFYRRTLEKRALKVNWQQIKPPIEILEGLQVSFDPLFLKNIQEKTVTFAQLPEFNRHLLQEIDSCIARRLEANSSLEVEIERDFAANYGSLRQGALGSPLLQNLLNTSGAPEAPVPAVAAKMIAIVNYIQNLKTEAAPGQTLSLQEETFLRVLASIQNCPTGKEEGIHSYYTNLPQAFKFSSLSNDASLSEKSAEWINALLRREVEHLLSGTNLYFKRLIGMNPDETIEQAAHQSRYVKNVIGPDVGLAEPLAFDRYSQMLYQKLIDRSKEELLQEFYLHFLPSKIIHTIESAANAELSRNSKLYTWLLALTPKAHLEECWYVDTELEKVNLTEKGALLLLNNLGILKIH